MICRRLAIGTCLAAMLTAAARADTAYKTLTLDREGNPIETQSAYRPAGSIEKIGDESLQKPADMAIREGRLYICDTENSRIVVGDLEGNLLDILGEGLLQKPTGLFLTGDGAVIVADQGAGKVFEFAGDGSLQREYGRPVEPLYGKSATFVPLKVAADAKDNLFVVSQGNTNGIVQLSRSTGEFLGYFGANATSVSLWDRISDVIFTEEQKSQTKKNLPPSANNLTIDGKGLVYTVTDVKTDQVVRKLNMSGQNLLTEAVDFENPSDILAGAIGNIYACTKDGYILEFNSEGQLLFLFGGLDDGSQRIGLFGSIASVAADDNGRLYVLDDGKNEIQIFEPTEFTLAVHEALSLYQQGKYLQSKEPWEQLLRMNNLFDYANKGIGEAYYREENYAAAMKSFRLAGDAAGYSQAYGELRNLWIRRNAVWLILAAALLLLAWKGLERLLLLHPRREAVSPPSGAKRLAAQTAFLFHVPRNPADAWYGVKREGKTSVLSASLLYLWFLLVFLADKYLTGFVFKTVPDGRYELLSDIGLVLGGFLLVNLCHYLICSVTDGEASFKNVYSGIIYACMPYLVLKPAGILLSHLLTDNERFLMTLLNVVVYGGCAVLLIVMVREMNNYTYRETFRNLFLTLFALLVAAAVLFILFVLGKQFLGFVTELVNEVKYRVKG